MRNTFAKILLLCSITIACSSPAQNKLQAYKRVFDKQLKSWTSSFNVFNLADFKEEGTRGFENVYPQDLKSLPSFLSTYKPILFYSKDSSAFIDIYSYMWNLEKRGSEYFINGDADQAILLYNKKKKYWDRLCFYGPGTTVQEAAWINNNEFLLVGVSGDGNGTNTPFILLGNFDKQSLISFGPTNDKCKQTVEDYKAPVLKRINIKW